MIQISTKDKALEAMKQCKIHAAEVSCLNLINSMILKIKQEIEGNKVDILTIE